MQPLLFSCIKSCIEVYFYATRQSLPGKLLITSANPAYTPFEIDLAKNKDNEEAAIVGRVEWFGRAIN